MGVALDPDDRVYHIAVLLDILNIPDFLSQPM